MSMINDALSKAVKEKNGNSPEAESATVSSTPVMQRPKNTRAWTISVISILFSIMVVGLGGLNSSLTIERTQRVKAEMALKEKDQKIDDLQHEVTGLIEQSRLSEDQFAKEKQQLAANIEELKNTISQMREERTAIAAELEAKKKALASASYQLYKQKTA